MAAFKSSTCYQILKREIARLKARASDLRREHDLTLRDLRLGRQLMTDMLARSSPERPAKRRRTDRSAEPASLEVAAAEAARDQPAVLDLEPDFGLAPTPSNFGLTPTPPRVPVPDQLRSSWTDNFRAALRQHGFRRVRAPAMQTDRWVRFECRRELAPVPDGPTYYHGSNMDALPSILRSGRLEAGPAEPKGIFSVSNFLVSESLCYSHLGAIFEFRTAAARCAYAQTERLRRAGLEEAGPGQILCLRRSPYRRSAKSKLPGCARTDYQEWVHNPTDVVMTAILISTAARAPVASAAGPR